MPHILELGKELFGDLEVFAFCLAKSKLCDLVELNLVVGGAKVHEVSKPNIGKPSKEDSHFPSDRCFERTPPVSIGGHSKVDSFVVVSEGSQKIPTVFELPDFGKFLCDYLAALFIKFVCAVQDQRAQVGKVIHNFDKVLFLSQLVPVDLQLLEVGK